MRETIESQRTPASDRRAFLVRTVLAASFCATGGALLAFFLTGWSLVILAAVFVGFAVTAWITLLIGMTKETRSTIGRRVAIGLISGFPAIAAYDLSRLA